MSGRVQSNAVDFGPAATKYATTTSCTLEPLTDVRILIAEPSQAGRLMIRTVLSTSAKPRTFMERIRVPRATTRG